MLFVVVALRNSLVWYVAKVWSSSHDFWSYLWGAVFQASGESDFIMIVVFTWLLMVIMYAASNAPFVLVDLTGRPAWLKKYKIQDEMNEPVDRQKYWKAAKQCLFNMVVVNLVFSVATYPVVSLRGSNCGYDIPSFPTVLLHLAAFLLVEELGFYYAHRLLHHRKLYKYFHKKHHEWTAPLSIISVYSHPLEHILSNIIPLYMGGFLMGSHLSVVWLWYSMAMFNTTHTHSGYHLPFMPSPEAHDFHHFSFTNNFGVLGILDHLHGTDVEFRKHISSKRHFTLKGFASAKEVVPDAKED